LPQAQVGRLLKTDLFDEAVSEGLYPLLTSCAEQVAHADVSPNVIRAARARYPDLHAACADVRRLPFADDVFDVIVSNSTLDHFAILDDVATSLRELRRVLCPGGELLLTLDNLANPAVALRNVLPFRVVRRLALVPYYVGATCGPRRLWRLVTEAGFEVREVGTLEHFPRVLAVAIAAFLEKHAKPAMQWRFLKGLMACELLARWPSRFITNHYLAMRAAKH
jgi:ubiquinone/menaquinone biosynthesis C-methylase UbiE